MVTLVVAAGTIAASTGPLRQLSDPSISFSSILVVTVVALLAPVLVNLAPRLRLPAVALEIVIGVIVGPSGLGWLEVDLPVVVLSLLGLAFLLFLAGLEIDPARLRGRIGAISLAFVASLGAGRRRRVRAPTGRDDPQPARSSRSCLASTSLGLVVPVIRDAGESETEFGQTVLAASSLAEFGTILLVSLFFSTSSSGTPGLGSNVFLLVAFSVLVVVVGLGMMEAGRSLRVSTTLSALEDTSAQLGVRAAVLLLVALRRAWRAASASRRSSARSSPARCSGSSTRRSTSIHVEFRRKVEAIGYGFLIPVFFVSSGARFDVDALVHSPDHLVLIPLFLLALLVVRGVPAFLYRRYFATRRVVAAGLLQATSLTFVVVAARLGLELNVFDEASGAALVAAGLLSVIVFPPIALWLLGDGDLADDDLDSSRTSATTGGRARRCEPGVTPDRVQAGRNHCERTMGAITVQTYETLFIGGEFVKPETGDLIDVISPHTEEVIGQVPDASPADIDKAVAAARKAFDAGPLPVEERAAGLSRLSAALQARGEAIADLISSQMGSPKSWSIMGQVFSSTMVLDTYAAIANGLHVGRRAPGCPRRSAAGAPRPRRRRGRDHPVERPAVHHRPEARSGDGGRRADRAEARTGDAARLLPVRGGGHRGRPAAGHHQHRSRRP